jgi:hypothetical protein
MPNPIIWTAKKVPLARMLILAELIFLVREHVTKLQPHERRRLYELVRQARGRPSNLSARERRELSELMAKAEPRAFVNLAARKVTGVRAPGSKQKRRR